MFGNTFVENDLFADVFDSFNPLKTSYTQSGDNVDEAGRPAMDDGDLSAGGEATRENDTNDPDNRI